jgi:TatD DNase family protein
MSTATPAAGEIIWADAHNHLHDARIPQNPSINGVGECPCLINATSEDDWEPVLQAAAQFPRIRHAALGVHPWFAHLVHAGWETRLRHHLITRHDLAIGECGLDRKTHACPLDIQVPVFETQLRLAREFNRPLTIHCVAAWGLLLEILERISPPRSWMVHGFSGSIETARRLIAMGAFLSIPVRALQPENSRIFEVFQSLPRDRILLETDSPNPPLPQEIDQSSASVLPWHLPLIGRELAKRFSCRPSILAATTSSNFKRFLISVASTE